MIDLQYIDWITVYLVQAEMTNGSTVGGEKFTLYMATIVNRW